MKGKARKTRRQRLSEKVRITKQLIDTANSLKNPMIDLKLSDTYVTKTDEKDLTFKIKCIKAIDTDPDCLSLIFDLMERNMKQMYEDSSWGWDFKEKQTELTESSAWYLIASREDNEEFVGFSHFRFDIDDGIEVLYCYELQLEVSARGKGLGRFMMSLLESMAYKTRMQKVILTVFQHNPAAIKFFHALGYKWDSTSPPISENLDYMILSKRTL